MLSRWVYSLLALLLLVILALWYRANVQPRVADAGESLAISYFSSTQPMSLKEVAAIAPERWQALPEQRASFGYTNKQYWFRFNLSSASSDRVLHIGYPLLDQLNLYWQQADSLTTFSLGDKQPYYERPILTSEFSIPIPAGTDQIIKAIAEGLLLREESMTGGSQQYFPGFDKFFQEKTREVFQERESTLQSLADFRSSLNNSKCRDSGANGTFQIFLQISMSSLFDVQIHRHLEILFNAQAVGTLLKFGRSF